MARKPPKKRPGLVPGTTAPNLFRPPKPAKRKPTPKQPRKPTTGQGRGGPRPKVGTSRTSGKLGTRKRGR